VGLVAPGGRSLPLKRPAVGVGRRGGSPSRTTLKRDGGACILVSFAAWAGDEHREMLTVRVDDRLVTAPKAFVTITL